MIGNSFITDKKFKKGSKPANMEVGNQITDEPKKREEKN